MPIDNYKKGFIPIIFLIIAGVVVLTGGLLVVREQFVKKGADKKAALDEIKIQKQIDKPSDFDTDPKTVPISTAPAGAVFTYTPKETGTEPKFTITPPSGWAKGDLGQFRADVRAYFETERDSENLTPPLVYHFPPQITVLFIKSDDVIKLSQAVEARRDSLEKQGDTVLSSRATVVNGMDAWVFEFTWKEKTGNVLIHQLEYVFLPKKGVMVMVDGVALDSAWSTREPEISRSLNSIRF